MEKVSSFEYEELPIYWDAELSAKRYVGLPARSSDLQSLGHFADRLASTATYILLYICIFRCGCIKSLKRKRRVEVFCEP